jgi:Brp/Blh family beta-carotene 15,15'-monooxygenase
MPPPSNLSQGFNLYLIIAVACVAASLVWIDRITPSSGLWALIGLTATVGFLHGVLDVRLMQQRFVGVSSVLFFGFCYLILVLLLAWWLSAAIDLALWLLLLMSAWHFGEPYARWDGLSRASQIFTRYVVGCAPIMLPILLSPSSLKLLLQPALFDPAIDVWASMAICWLTLLLFWLLFCGVKSYRAAHYAWYELIGVLLLNLIFSPVMAFALYFGVYHAPAHIWRVVRSQPPTNTMKVSSLAGTAGVLIITLLFSMIVWHFLAQTAHSSTGTAHIIQWLIVVLAALTLPHLVLVSLCSRQLSSSFSRRS